MVRTGLLTGSALRQPHRSLQAVFSHPAPQARKCWVRPGTDTVEVQSHSYLVQHVQLVAEVPSGAAGPGPCPGQLQLPWCLLHQSQGQA